MDIFRLFNKHRPYKTAKSFKCGLLSLDNTHKMYYELSGNPKGVPVLILHGGPGAGLSKSKRKYFNPKKYFIIQYDQRGCGKSEPNLCLKDNITLNLINDIEVLREHLKIDKWVVCGGSWGSTLALLYSVAFKNRVLSLIINGVLLGSSKELNDPYKKNGIPAQVYPDKYQDLVKDLSEEEKQNPLTYFIDKTFSDDADREEILKKLIRWELGLCVLNPDFNKIEDFINSEKFVTDIAVIEMHYIKNNLFINSSELLDKLETLSDIPTFIINGRYDILCPPEISYKVHNKIKRSELLLTFDGHSIKSKKGMEFFVYVSNKILKLINE